MDPNFADTPDNNPSVSGQSKLKNKLGRLKPRKKHAGLLIFVFVIALIGGTALVYRNQNSKTEAEKVLGSITGEEEKETQEMIKNVGELTVIPENEKPEIATIADTTKLDSQPFFDRAQNGDKVIIFRTAKRVVLYRPSTNKVIETGPLSEPTPTPGQ